MTVDVEIATTDNPASSSTIVIADEEPMLRETLSYILEGAGYQTLQAATCEEVRAATRAYTPALVLLSERLLCVSGEVCPRLCCDLSVEEARLLMWNTNAAKAKRRRIMALECGADGYLIKPFGMRELMARIYMLLQHAEQLPEIADGDLRVGNLRLNTSARRVWIAEEASEREVLLACKEFDLLHYLMANAGRVVTHDELIEWSCGGEAENALQERTKINVTARALNRKFRPKRPVSTVRSKGFMLKIKE